MKFTGLNYCAACLRVSFHYDRNIDPFNANRVKWLFFVIYPHTMSNEPFSFTNLLVIKWSRYMIIIIIREISLRTMHKPSYCLQGSGGNILYSSHTLNKIYKNISCDHCFYAIQVRMMVIPRWRAVPTSKQDLMMLTYITIMAIL